MTAVSTVDDAAALAQLLRDNAAAKAPRRVRLGGRGTRPRLLAPPATDALRVSLRRLDRIERLEPDDLTCSVQPGVGCGELAAALRERGLELGGLRADDQGTVGGLFAADPLGPPVPGSACPRSTLLGIEAVSADGSAFRSGARVVKSVAGFDVHRLLVGSLGRAFAVTLLHLKLRPAPRAVAGFATAALSPAAAIATFLRLRELSTPPQRLVLHRTAATEGIHVSGWFAGRARQVEELRREQALPAADRAGADHLGPPPAGHELLVGRTRATAAAALLGLLPATAPFALHAGGHFETIVEPIVADALLPGLPTLAASGAIALSPIPARIGHRTAGDPATLALQQRVARALDPQGLLT